MNEVNFLSNYDYPEVSYSQDVESVLEDQAHDLQTDSPQSQAGNISPSASDSYDYNVLHGSFPVSSGDALSGPSFAPLNYNYPLINTQLDIFDRIVQGSDYNYYYAYQYRYSNSETQYFLYLCDEYSDGVMIDPLLIQYTTNNVGSYLSRSTPGSYSPQFDSDICYTNLVSDYPILGGSSYREPHGFQWLTIVLFIALLLLGMKLLFSSFRGGRYV